MVTKLGMTLAVVAALGSASAALAAPKKKPVSHTQHASSCMTDEGQGRKAPCSLGGGDGGGGGT
jgi:hypothetical protein